MTSLKVTWNRPHLGEHTGWARTCVALAGGRGARAIVGEYLTEGEQLLETDTLVLVVEPHWRSSHEASAIERATIWRVVATAPNLGTLVPATSRDYNWRTEHVSLREKLAELLAADADGCDLGDGTEHERAYLTECDRLRHYLARAARALAEVDALNGQALDSYQAIPIGESISGPLAAIRKAYPELSD